MTHSVGSYFTGNFIRTDHLFFGEANDQEKDTCHENVQYHVATEVSGRASLPIEGFFLDGDHVLGLVSKKVRSEAAMSMTKRGRMVSVSEDTRSCWVLRVRKHRSCHTGDYWDENNELTHGLTMTDACCFSLLGLAF